MTLTSEQITIVEQNPLKNALDQSRAKLRNFDPSDDSWRSGVIELLNTILGHSTSGLLLAPDGKNYLDVELVSIRRSFMQGSFELVNLQALVENVIANAPDIRIWEAVLDLIDALNPSPPSPSNQHPLKDALDQSRAKLRDFDPSDDSFRPGVAELLDVLSLSLASGLLLAPDGKNYLYLELFSIRIRYIKGSFQLSNFQPLVESVVAHVSDIHIWEAVLKLVAEINPSTPSPSEIASTFRGTPIESKPPRRPADSDYREDSHGSDDSKWRDNCTFRKVGGFWDKFFEPESWRKEQNAMLERILTAHDGKKWTNFPTDPDDEPVWDWLCSLEKEFLEDAPNKFHTTSIASQVKKRKGQMNLFLRKPTAKATDAFLYKHVLVVGVQKEAYDKSMMQANLLRLARHVRGVFADQPTRRFVHAFSLYASKMELWVFDRSGPYSSGTFDIHDEPDKFARALVGYTTMDDDALGLDMVLERQDGHRYITLYDASGKETRLRLDKAMNRCRAIVSRGTTCYETQHGHVAKLQWALDQPPLEFEQLKLAETMGVEGVVRVVAHRRFTSIAEMREGLQFPKAYRFRLPHEDESLSDMHDSPCSPRTPDGSSGSKKPPSADQESNLGNGCNDDPSNGEAKPGLDTTGEKLWENKIFSCLVISPAGREISDFRSIKELLECARDAIRAHRSLYLEGKILHRDISPHNIIITRPATADGFKGMLIDLDMACTRESDQDGASQAVGTLPFMAVEVLLKINHTYRHDVESFFYVLLRMCGCEAWDPVKGLAVEGEKQRKESRFRKWHVGTLEGIAESKQGQMANISNLRMMVMCEFPKALDVVKPLCEELLRIIFPPTEYGRNYGTPWSNPDDLYGPVITAFGKAISLL
ncbi:hypothetical protein E4U57_006878 [Claviceps arundinis]|uniref:EKC/KEOPS complex subunit BUD32 n=1 Tax=Claviceps arundinis TaxID=1623583 RepID=A0ABQ7P1F8_9HYPO|nr:hypothetical protein E4U57_006878 [Claviceps arundinis]